MWDLLWDLSQERRISEADSRASAAGMQASAVDQRVDQLEKRVERLSLVCMAMWELLRAQPGFTEADLRARVDQIDEADGVKDGRVGARVQKCTGCGRNMSARKGKCIYCGTIAPNATAFSGL